jgi:DNA-damage-inducible protein J
MPTIQFRTDEAVKAQSTEIFQELGITMSDAINMFLRQAILHGGLPFELRLPRYNAETVAAMQEARDIIAGKIKRKSYSSFREYLADMENDKL